MLIFKEGKFTPQFRKYKKYTCKTCGCELLLTDKDFTDNDRYDDQMFSDDGKYIICPNCKTKIFRNPIKRILKPILTAILFVGVWGTVFYVAATCSKYKYTDMIIKNITNEELKDSNTAICITIPKTVKWEDYQKELDEVKDGKYEMNFKVPVLPKKVFVGDRCYLCYNGNVIGWMKISSMGPKKFTSTTDGKSWTGNFISRTGEFHKIKPVPCKGFRGYKYITYYGDNIVFEQ